MASEERPVPHKEAKRRALAEEAAERKRARSGRRTQTKQERRGRERAWAEANDPELPLRKHAPEEVVFHLGPTNSGKTFESLNALADAGSGVYAAPLRQLAHEAYERLSEMLPLGTVGLSTGEEEENPGAPIICATVEKAPQSGRLLVLDEAHWVTDVDRGHHWTRLVLSGQFETIHVISAAEAEPLLRPLVSDAAEVQVVRHARLSRLDLEERPVPVRSVPAQTLVVAFSRKSVYAVARVLAETRKGKVGVLYGALPPATRREVIRAFTRGELEVLVTTDVIGHGINVPAMHVLFAETVKFDGTVRRDLHTWEAAQIAGRAGRYGMHDHGTVGVLSGVRGLEPSLPLLEEAVPVARGDAASDLPQRAPTLRPELSDLGAKEPAELATALRAWHSWAREAASVHGIEAENPAPLIVRLEALKHYLTKYQRGATLDVVWRLLNLPVDYNPPRQLAWIRLAEVALRHLDGRKVERHEILPQVPGRSQLSALEETALSARHSLAVLRQFPGIAGVTKEEVAEVEKECSERITRLLPKEIQNTKAGRCETCDRPTAPWFKTCRDCYDPWY